jgi:hypothetical protein
MTNDWHALGTIVRLQIQRSSLKVGPQGGRYFDPGPLLAVDELYATTDGVAADADGTLLDVHNARHPNSKNVRGINGISVGFTAHYRQVRERFGAHVTDGIAGENVLVAIERPVALEEIAGGLRIESDDGRCLELAEVVVAHPCVEFSRFVLADRAAPPQAVTPVLQFLDDGMRGFYALVQAGRPARIALGDRVYGKGSAT